MLRTEFRCRIEKFPEASNTTIMKGNERESIETEFEMDGIETRDRENTSQGKKRKENGSQREAGDCCKNDKSPNTHSVQQNRTTTTETENPRALLYLGAELMERALRSLARRPRRGTSAHATRPQRVSQLAQPGRAGVKCTVSIS